jgi:hypothetical protein
MPKGVFARDIEFMTMVGVFDAPDDQSSAGESFDQLDNQCGLAGIFSANDVEARDRHRLLSFVFWLPASSHRRSADLHSFFNHGDRD